MIEDFIDITNSCKTTESLFKCYTDTIAEFGFTSAIYTFMTDHVEAKQKAGHGVKSNFPDDWMEHYAKKKYDKIDPVIHEAFKTSRAFSWDDIKQRENLTEQQKDILNQADEAGLKNGVGIPLYGARAELAGVGLASSDPLDYKINQKILSQLQFITEQFHNVYCSIGGADNDIILPKMTKRELEILKWTTAGKTKDEISIIFGCSESTIRFHMKNIFYKLDATSKIQAVTKAIRLGLVAYDTIEI